MKYILYLFLAISLLVSCTKELPYPDLNKDDYLVVNGLLSPETGASIHLSQSCHISDTQCGQKNIEDAQVFLKDESGNQLVELTHQAAGLYEAKGFQIDYNKTYMIEAISAGMESIQAKTNTPKPFNSTLIDFDEKIYEGFLCRTFEIEIKDNPDETNYYLIDGWIDILNGNHDEGLGIEFNGYQLPHTGFVTKDVNADNGAMISNTDIKPYPIEYVFLSDENFNGETYKLEFGLYDEDLSFDKDFVLEAHLSIKSVSKDLFDYYKSITLYKLTASNLLSEPEQIFSNIEKGVGILGGFTQEEIIVNLPKTEHFFDGDFTVINEGCTAPCTVKFFTDIGNKVNFIWDFGDGTTSTEKNPEHEFQESGLYNVSISISRGDGVNASSREILIN